MYKLLAAGMAAALMSVVFTLLMAISLWGHDLVYSLVFGSPSDSDMRDLLDFISHPQGDWTRYLLVYAFDLFLALGCGALAGECPARLLRIELSMDSWLFISYITAAINGIVRWHTYKIGIHDWISGTLYFCFFAAMARGAYGGIQYVKWRRLEIMSPGN